MGLAILTQRPRGFCRLCCGWFRWSRQLASLDIGGEAWGSCCEFSIGVIAKDEGLAEDSETLISSGEGCLEYQGREGDVDGQLVVLFVGSVTRVYISGRRGCLSVDAQKSSRRMR